MKRTLSIAIMFLATAGVAMAQIGAAPTTDVLGAHLNYGRGCTGCHAPHSGANGNGVASATDATSGNVALWGEDVKALYGQTLLFGEGYSETLPSTLDKSFPDAGGILVCLSCHDGNLAKGAMMQNAVFETLPATYGTKNVIPTLLGNDLTGTGNYLNDHPVGSNAIIGCGGYSWDCTISATGAIQPGPLMSQFINNYGFFVKPGVMNNQPVVLCTTCHNQHLMNVVKVTKKAFTYTDGTKALSGTQTGLATGYYSTMFFIRAPYNPASGTTGTNQAAQFCRQCHGGEANEMNNSSAVTIW